MPLSYLPKSKQENQWMYRYSPFRNIGPQPSYEKMDYNEKRRADNRTKLEGQIFHTKQGYDIKIVDYMDVHNVIVQFICDGFLKLTSMGSIKKGLVGYPFHKNRFGGYPGVGPYRENVYKKYHSMWFGVLTRTGEEFSNNSKYRLYKNVSLYTEWYNFQNFAAWLDWYFSILNPDPSFDYQIDKDILQFNQEYKIYSPNTCCIIPRPLNSALECMQVEKTVNPNVPKGVRFHGYFANGDPKYTASCSYGAGKNSVYLGCFRDPMEAFNAYKKEKERYIRELADNYLAQGAIFPSVRDAIYNIEIKPFGI